VWVDLVLFLVWLVLPPTYVVVLGRYYVRQCELVYRLLCDKENRDAG
jgi:hypothetical protein